MRLRHSRRFEFTLGGHAMRIVFDEGFESGAWPGPGGLSATAGESWVGPAGFLTLLEGLTGLARRWPSRGERVAALVPRLAQVKGFWDASAATDALSTAEKLLELRDQLVLHGWRGHVDAPRLEQLAALALDAGGSEGDRLAQLCATLATFPQLVGEVVLLEPRVSLPKSWQLCLASLEAKGTAVAVRPAPRASSKDGLDLAAVKTRTSFAPQSDGSLQLIRPFAPILAADAVAAALASSRDTPTLLVGADAILDAALHRYGLPTVGGPGDASDNSILQLLPLVVALAAKPADPARALELLTLPQSPGPRGIAGRLVQALQKWPAIGSPSWVDALAEGLGAIPEAAKRIAAEARLAKLFEGSVSNGAWPAKVLVTRTQALREWLIGRQKYEEDDTAKARYAAALIQCAEFEALLRATGQPDVSTAQLKLLLERATATASGGARFDAQAGLRSVVDPAGVAGPIDRVVWWNFTLDAAPRLVDSIWSRTELSVLSKAGVALPSPGEQAKRLARRFARPLDQARTELWLVTPERGAGGEENAPHPLWDEVLGLLSESRQVSALSFTAPKVKAPLPHALRRLLSLPSSRLQWKTSVKLSKRPKESASSIESLLGCSLHWALHYFGKLAHGETSALPGDSQLLGSLAHEVVGETMRGSPATGDIAAREAEQRFMMDGPLLAAPLFLPGHDAERADALAAACASALQLGRLLEAGFCVEGVERVYTGKALGTDLEGTLDLVLKKGEHQAIVDLKWGGYGHKRGILEGGAAIQLAVYAELLRQTGARDVSVAYFILLSQAMLTADARLLDSNSALQLGHDAAGTWTLVARTWESLWKTMGHGELSAPGTSAAAPLETKRGDDGSLRVAPPCRYCDYAGLCGRLYGREEDANGEA
jgi:hypothetical protein